MTRISNLPKDMIEQILARVPIKSMRKVRSTCKNWNSISKDESFIMKMHIGNNGKEEEYRMMVLKDNNLWSVSVEFDDDHPSTEPRGKLVCLDKEIKISAVFHCEGLLLCRLKDDSTRFLVWNPVWGETRWIEPPYPSHHPNRWDGFVYALGYEDKDSGRSLKLLRFKDYYFEELENPCYEMYDLDSGLWTSLDVTPQWCILMLNNHYGVSLKGNTYWCVGARNSSGEDRFVDQIICFDFTKERFGPLLPLPCSGWLDEDYVTLSCVRQEKLAVLLSHNEVNPYHLEIWITTKTEVGMVSWSKFLAMETEHPIYVPSIPWYFIDEEKKVAMGFNEDYPKTFSIIGEAEYSIKLDLLGAGSREVYWGCTYVPSLVQIKKPTQGKRKRQDSSEKLRFDQNRNSRLKLV